jgi:hypothetical protein
MKTFLIYIVLFVAINEMTIPFESRKFNGGTNSTTNLPQKNLTMMNSDEIVQVRCMYDQFYNIIMAGFPMDMNVRFNLYRINLHLIISIAFRTIKNNSQWNICEYEFIEGLFISI